MVDIVWVEDQFHWLDKLSPVLKAADLGDGENNNQLTTFGLPEAACQHFNGRGHAPDVVLLDANMNGDDHAGFRVSRVLHKRWPDVPIVYLSEHSGSEIEQTAFEKLETQDFVAKHQQNIEQILCWRIKAVLRQVRIHKGQTSTTSADGTLSRGPLTIDLTTWEAYWHGKKVMNPNNSQRPLPPIPRKILRLLAEHSPRPLTTLQIADYLEMDHFNYASYRQHIKTLRRALEHASNQAGQPSFLELCKKGQGIVTFGDEGAYCWKPLD